MRPLVSIVTPMFNAEPFIAETIESVLAQTYENWEMLVVDNCSTDRSREVVLDYANRDTRIRLVELDFNSGGPARPRNIGIRHALGDYLAFLDADDIWKPEKLERQVRHMLGHPEVGLLYSPCLPTLGGKIKKQSPRRWAMKAGHIFEALFLSDNFIVCSSVLLRKGSAIPLEFDEDSRMVTVEDFDLWLRISQVAVIDFIAEPLVIYRLHERNLSYGVTQYGRRILYMVGKWRVRTYPALIFAKYGRLIVTVSVMCLIFLMEKVRGLIHSRRAY
ncbi:MAG: glycosyltransferase family 2 protein [Dissulfurispiraceae bacterium]